MAALVLLPPLPPEEPVVACGPCQAWFDFVDVVIVVRAVRPRPRRGAEATSTTEHRVCRSCNKRRATTVETSVIYGRAIKGRHISVAAIALCGSCASAAVGQIRQEIAGQERIEDWKPSAPSPEQASRRRTPTKLRVWEREQMREDVAFLTADGAYADRPRMAGGKADCPTGPCPWIGCRLNLFVTIRPSGAVKYNFPGKDIDEVGETCANRVATDTSLSHTPLPFRKLAKYTNETYARAEQVNGEAMQHFVRNWAEMYPDDPPPKFRKE
jgi:hypothetical protein